MSNETERLDLYMSRIMAGNNTEATEPAVSISVDNALYIAKAAMKAVDDSIAADKQATLDAARADVVANVAAVMGCGRPPVGTVAKGKDLDLRVGDVVCRVNLGKNKAITSINCHGQAMSLMYAIHDNIYTLISRADEATKEQAHD